MTYSVAPVVIPAVPPKPPQVTLVSSSVLPGDAGFDPPSVGLPDTLSDLPPELRDELRKSDSPLWVRGFTYAPENRGSAWLRDRCDGTTYDFESLPAPVAGSVSPAATSGGTLSAGTKTYEITFVNANGETTPSGAITQVVTANQEVTLTISDVPNGVTVNVYGRVSGSLGLLGNVGPVTSEGGTLTFTDTGSGSPGASPPSSNTTGGPGSYTNPAIITVVPFAIETMDQCSTFGFEERDFKGRALRWLDSATPHAIEAEFWTGTLAQAKGLPNPYLTMGSSAPNGFTNLTPSGTPPSVARGMQILQDYLAQTGFGGQGMIHTQAQTAPDLLAARRVGKLLLDIFDNIVVPGVGYTGSQPAGTSAPAAGTAWMYATDMVMVRIQPEGRVIPDTFEEAVDRGQGGEPNTVTFRAFRFAAAYADFQAYAGCQVTLPT